MKRLLLAAVIAFAASACATRQPAPAANRVVLTAEAVDLARAADSIRGSTKAEVSAALGPAAVVRFDSGYEVWVYRFDAAARKQADKPSPASQAQTGAPPSELVLLFNPAGEVTRVRIRSPSPRPP